MTHIIPLAPLHEQQNLAAVPAVSSVASQLPQVACFDTAFHRTQSPVEQLYALPRELPATGISNDMRKLLSSDTTEAAEAIGHFMHRIGRELGSLAALGGLDALVFTGGPRISSDDSAVPVWVIPTNEELMIAQHTLACIHPGRARP
jgi:acetate kinase